MAKQHKSTLNQKQISNQEAKAKSRQVEPVSTPLEGNALFEEGDIQGQAMQLAGIPWQQGQRQGLAARIGQLQGNRHLQRVVEIARQGAAGDTPSGLRDLGQPRQDIIARRVSDAPYTPGEMSKRYWKLPAAERAEVNVEVDHRFEAETGVTRHLDPDNPDEQPLINIWLRLRDQVMQERTGEPEKPEPEKPEPEKPEKPEPEKPEPEKPKTGLSYDEAKKQIMANGDKWGTDEEGIYTAIRQCYEREKLAADPEVQALLEDEMSGHELWKAQLLLAFGSEAAYPEPIKEIWKATKGWGTDEEAIYKALQGLDQTEIAKISKVPGLRAMLQSELSGKDLTAAEDLLSGQYAKAIARHKTNVAFVKAELTRMKEPANPLQVRNTAEWLDPSDASQKPKNDMYVLTPTHDSAKRAKEHGQKGKVAYFGDSPQYPADTATYDAHVSSKRNIHYSAPTVGGEHLGRKIWMHDPAFQTGISLEQVLVHEVQHDADRHDTEAGHDKPFKSPEESWNRYKTEFRAYWIDGQRDHLSTRSGSAAPPWDNARQEAIFKHMYGTSDDDVYAVWLRPNYDKNTKVNGQNFQDLVHNYTKPEGVNPINSPRIDNFFLELDKCKPKHTDLTQPPLVGLEAAANALNGDDQTYVNSTDAARLQEMMKTNLAGDVLTHIATIVNGGSKPGWL